MDEILKKSGQAYKLLCVVILALMVLIVFVNTMLRYFYHSGIVQGEEVLRYLFVWLTFLGIMAVYKEHGNIAVTILTDHLSPRVAAIMSLIANAIAVFAFAVLAFGSVAYMKESETTVGQLTGLPYRYIIAAILLAACVCLLLSIRDTVVAFRDVLNPPPPEEKTDIPKSVREKLAQAKGEE